MGLNTNMYGPAERKFKQRQQERRPVYDAEWDKPYYDDISLGMMLDFSFMFKHRKR